MFKLHEYMIKGLMKEVGFKEHLKKISIIRVLSLNDFKFTENLIRTAS